MDHANFSPKYTEKWEIWWVPILTPDVLIWTTLAKQVYLNPVITKFRNWRTVKIHVTINSTDSQQTTEIVIHINKNIRQKDEYMNLIYQSTEITQN